MLGTTPLVDVRETLTDDVSSLGRGRGTRAARCSRCAVCLPVAIGVIVPVGLTGPRRAPLHSWSAEGTSCVPLLPQGRPAPTSPKYQMGSNSTTVPVWAAWMIVSAP